MRRTVLALLITAAAVLTVVLLWQLPQWQTAEWRAFLTPRELLDLQNQLRQTLALLLAAGAILTGLPRPRHRRRPPPDRLIPLNVP